MNRSKKKGTDRRKKNLKEGNSQVGLKNLEGGFKQRSEPVFRKKKKEDEDGAVEGV